MTTITRPSSARGTPAVPSPGPGALRGALLLVLATLLAVALAACGGGPAPTPVGTMGPDDVAVASTSMQFAPRDLSVRSGRPFAIWFDNRDGAPHNVSLRDAAGAVVYTGDVFSGPAVRVYAVPALTAGSYRFICDLHPNMTGTLTAI